MFNVFSIVFLGPSLYSSLANLVKKYIYVFPECFPWEFRLRRGGLSYCPDENTQIPRATASGILSPVSQPSDFFCLAHPSFINECQFSNVFRFSATDTVVFQTSSPLLRETNLYCFYFLFLQSPIAD